MAASAAHRMLDQLHDAVEYSRCLPAGLVGEAFYDWHDDCSGWADNDMPPATVALWTAVAVTVALACWMFTRTARPAYDRPLPYSLEPPSMPDYNILEKPSLHIPGSTAIQCYSPATGQLLGTVRPATAESIDRAVEDAHKAQRTWRTTTFRQRRAVLRSMLAYVLANQEQLCRIACLDSGETMADAELGEIFTTVEKLRWTLAHGEAAIRTEIRPTSPLLFYKRSTVRHGPLGVVAALVSWNYPFHNLLGPVISAIFAGNGIVVRVSEQTAWSAGYFADVARKALEVHGHDPDLVQPVACWPGYADRLTSHRGISHVAFIGSRQVYPKVAAAAARSLTPVCAELGGMDTAIVLDSVSETDFARVIELILRGTFQSAGQSRIGIERIVASLWMCDNLAEALIPRVCELRRGAGPKGGDVGAMISEEAVQRMERLVTDAYDKGARVFPFGSGRLAHSDFPQGHYFQPTVVSNVTTEMEMAREECFGPVMVLMEAASGSAEDLLEAAHAGHETGLGGCVFGDESDPRLQQVVDGMRSGMVAVNDFGAAYAVRLAFGRVRDPGCGRFAGAEGLRALCSVKSVSEDRWPTWRLRIRTVIPPWLRHPVQDQDQDASWRSARRAVDIGHGPGWGARIRAAFGMARA